ncbi:hypothetical protein FRC19_010552 [Serendipita sp. 401]|nr:hypothetical protein FRC19_010552 [Serendipita sp. 401]KAG9044995.1 hypothetical protein FS842_001291 [Serendipita sp. 407]
MTETDSSASDYTRGQPRRHHSLYFEDGTLVMRVSSFLMCRMRRSWLQMSLKVENAIFKVHRSLLARSSTAIQDMLSVPSGKGPHDGTDENPLIMSGDSVVGWELLLGLQYSVLLNRFQLPKGEDLLTILPIVHKYCMEEIEANIIRELKATFTYDGFVNLIVASRLIDCNSLYQDGLQRLFKFGTFPTLEQAKRMGVETTHAVMKSASDHAVASSLAKADNQICRHCQHSTNWKCSHSSCQKPQRVVLSVRTQIDLIVWFIAITNHY